MRSRFHDAKAIIDGASNPIAIVNTLVKMIEDIRQEEPGANVLDDVAFRLAVYQLAHLTRAFNMSRDLALFSDMMDDLEHRIRNPIKEEAQ